MPEHVRPDGTPGWMVVNCLAAAPGDPHGDPPYLRRMITSMPAGMRIDTSAPDQCTATDAELAVLGPDACPPGSRLGGGTLEGLIYEPVVHGFVFDHYQHPLELL